MRSPHPSLRPFDRRFKARLSTSPLGSPRAISPAFLSARSRQSSSLTQLFSDPANLGTSDTPWEVVSWIRLRKLSGEAFSEVGKRNYGRPTCIAVSTLIAIGTSKGIVLVFDYHQNLKAIIGVGTRAPESGSVTSIALSADFSTVASGHANGSIFTWEIAKPAKPFLQIISTDAASLQSSRLDGHVSEVAVLHLGFLGTRHTALASADDKGMAFSHLASRGLGTIARSVKTTRILGRYPETGPISARSRKPSSVLAFAPLPLGSLETASDGLGLVAMLTPYLLVVVSTTPIAQTQHKASRPKELAAHGAMTAALAWYPAMKTKNTSFNAKLAYCWLNVVTILELEEIQPSADADRERPVDLYFRPQKRWEAEESIVGMQWLNRTVLALLTVSQQLIILEDGNLTVTDSSDLIKKHIYHVDLFSQQLDRLVENLDEENISMHGVVADAFYMSFKAYKGRLFLLGFNDVAIGTLSNWADRLFALMEQGDFIGAIQLATSYYGGGADKAAIGLPADDFSRHALVRGKLTEMMAASLRYAFGKNPDADTTRVSESQLEHLARACFVACLMLEDVDFLFDDVYSWYSENSSQNIFLRILETCISDGEIRTVPPGILKDLVNDFVDRGHSARLEEIICLLDPSTMDLDRVTSLCKEFKLHDALFYIWSQAIWDYVTVLKDMLDYPDEGREMNGFTLAESGSGSKVFPYLSYTLTGRVYPTGDWLSDDIAVKAKADVYHVLFSGSTSQGEGSSTFHYLRKLLDLDASSFMSMLNEAFEDNFLDESSDTSNIQEQFSGEQRFGLSLTRQFVIRILLGVLVPPEYEPEDIIYLDMFIARNQPKFPQFIRLPGSVLHRVFVELCNHPSYDIADDCQLSLEYLLSVYQPPELSTLLPLLRRARFFRVIKSVYKADKQYAQLLRTCFEDDESPETIFECIEDCFGPTSGLEKKQLDSLRQVIVENASKFLYTDLSKAAMIIDENLPDLHRLMIETLDTDQHSQYIYLRAILEERKEKKAFEGLVPFQSLVELYVRLLCDYDPHHVPGFVDNLATGDLRLQEVIPAMEKSGVIDAAVILMAREGKVREAMNRLLQHLRYLEVALVRLLEKGDHTSDTASSYESAEDLIESIGKYNKVGLWLCETCTRSLSVADSTVSAAGRRSSRIDAKRLDTDLLDHEQFWLDLIDATVKIARETGDLVNEWESSESKLEDRQRTHDFAFVSRRLRTIVQDTFTGLLATTSVPATPGQTSTNLAFLRILKAFLNRVSQSSPSLVHLRGVLSAIFSAYAYEESLLSLANQLLGKDLFVRIEEASERRKRGWRPSGQACSGCGLRVWGPGVGAGAWDAWNGRQSSEQTSHDMAGIKSRIEDNGKGKNKAVDAFKSGQRSSTPTQGSPLLIANQDALIIFSCRHSYHKRCLEDMLSKIDSETGAASGSAAMMHESQSIGPPSYRCPLEQSATSTKLLT